MNIKRVYDYIDKHSQNFIQELARLVKQPSISAKGEGMQKCAEIVEKMLREVGFSTQVIPEKNGNPVVYGELKSQNSKKTLLFYDHYDVQPPEPLEEWKFDAFSGKVYEGRIYGRGVSDNKGNIVSRIKVVEAFLKAVGDVPVNVKFVVEGEEEIGSPHFAPVVKQHKDLFSNDATIWEFGGTNYEGRPEIYLGLKGVLSVELRTKGASRDVHSANAPLVQNPAWRLVWALNTLKNEEDEILIEGFYDNVEPPSKEELQLLDDIPLEEEKLKRTLGLKEFLHKKTGREAKKTLLYSPTCTINGFLAGYTGPGSKTVLPKEAMVKLDFRLVPNQMPDKILEKLREHLKKGGFKDIEAIRYGSTEPTKTPVTDKFVNVVVKAAEKIYGKRAVVYPTSAASGPMHLFRNWLGCPVVSAGCSHADAKGHAPNENLTIEGFIKGSKFMATVLNDFSQS
ncbi:MAG: M20/M25/M40 family metallo-hydrolase [Candidatus Bathyarchaeota archaeon]|nr:M20/M25/M40 family metallo-hydrolase [Candidatus Bathyarchaeota archaeon]MDH5494816.1 M20/M25/M40 family metallo-hydrolase [Candidatus Bathyarchaeota archaeon]